MATLNRQSIVETVAIVRHLFALPFKKKKLIMKVMKSLFLAISVSVLLAAAASGQTAAKQPYKSIELERFTVRQGVEFADKDVDELRRATVRHLVSSKRFDSVTMAGESAASETTGPRLKISGEITKYVKGSQAARYLVGFGAGKTKIMADIKMVDAATGETVFHQTVDGDVTWGAFGGDSDDAKGGVADEMIREMKKRGFAGEKKK
jgi:curli biogenesis system outer membrane secretion channel CsgG